LSANGSKFTSGLEAAKKSLLSFVGGVSGMGGALSNIKFDIQGLGGALAGGIGAGIKESVAAFARFEKTQLVMERMLGSAEAAKAMLTDLAELDRRSPFTFQGLAEAAQGFLAIGFNARQTTFTLEKLTDIVAAMPGDTEEAFKRIAQAIKQIWAKGVAKSEELTGQLAEHGIPIWDALAKALGTDVAGAMKKVEAGGVSAATAIKALLSLADDPKFKGLGKDVSNSLGGIWSSLKSAWNQLETAFGKIFSEGFDLKLTGQKITQFFDNLRSKLNVIKPLVFSVGAAFGVMRDTVLTALTKVVNALHDWGAGLGDVHAGAERLRHKIIDVAKTITTWLGRAINFVIADFGKFLNEAVAGLLKATSALLRMMARLSDPEIQKRMVRLQGALFGWSPEKTRRAIRDNVNVAAGDKQVQMFQDMAAEVDDARFNVQAFGRQLMAVDINRWDNAIGDFFEDVRKANKPGKGGPMPGLAPPAVAGLGAALAMGGGGLLGQVAQAFALPIIGAVNAGKIKLFPGKGGDPDKVFPEDKVKKAGKEVDVTPALRGSKEAATAIAKAFNKDRDDKQEKLLQEARRQTKLLEELARKFNIQPAHIG
jgi:tape measure domain-containing protein